MDAFKWEKQGLLYDPEMHSYSHGSHPCIIHWKDDTFIVAFSCRNEKQQSHIFLSYARVADGQVELQGEPHLALYPGPTGFFDCDGVISGCLIKNDNQFYLYFIGWQNLPDNLWQCDTGRARLDPEHLELEREFSGPILGRDRNHPLFAAATAFFITPDGRWHTWYNSGIEWTRRDNGWHHRYGLHHATSPNGLDWDCDPGMCIPFADEYEYAFGRPSVVYWDNLFHMWFAHRATRDIETYRIGYAASPDGLRWDRDDSRSGIDVSPSGWDTEMICYPCVFQHKGYRYMLYNGNSYGRTGFGLAVLNKQS